MSEKPKDASLPEPPSTPSGQANPSDEGFRTARRRLLVGSFAAGPVLYAATTRSALATRMASPSKVFSGNVSSPGDSGLYQTGHSPEYWVNDTSRWGNSLAAPSPQAGPRNPPGPPIEPPGLSGDKAGSNPPAGHGRFGGFPPDTPGRSCAADAASLGSTFRSVFGNDSGLKPLAGLVCGEEHPTRAVTLWEVLAFPNEVSDTSIDGMSLGAYARYIVAAYLNAVNLDKYPVTAGQVKRMWTDARSPTGFCPSEFCGSHSWFASDVSGYLQSTWT